MTRTVLFVCVENACRSLMAEAMFNADPPPGWIASSAGVRPVTAPNPRTAGMLRELGLTLPSHPPRELTPSDLDGASLVVTMGCTDAESCPARLRAEDPRDWGLRDPAALDDPEFRAVRDELVRRVDRLRQELAGRDSATPAHSRG